MRLPQALFLLAAVALAPVATSQYPGVTISASPPTVPAGGKTTITWASDQATACFASWSAMGAVPLSGSYTTTVNASQLFTVYCNGTAAMYSADGSPTSGWPSGSVNQPESVFVAVSKAPSAPTNFEVH